MEKKDLRIIFMGTPELPLKLFRHSLKAATML